MDESSQTGASCAAAEDGDGRYSLFTCHCTSPPPPAPAPGIMSIIIGVPFLQNDVAPEVPRAAPQTEGVAQFLGPSNFIADQQSWVSNESSFCTGIVVVQEDRKNRNQTNMNRPPK